MTGARWLSHLAKHRWYTTAGTAACLAAAASGALAFAPRHPPARHPRALAAADCGIVTCSATIPPRPTASAAASLPPTTRPQQVTAAPQAVRSPAAAAKPGIAARTPLPLPPPPPPPPPAHPSPSAPAVTVTVAYSLVQRWPGGLQGQFTIVNHGSTALAGWQLRAVFPGDQIDSAWGASSQSGGSTLVMTASYPPAIPPGASQSVDFTAQGSTAAPASCTIDGAPCG